MIQGIGVNLLPLHRQNPVCVLNCRQHTEISSSKLSKTIPRTMNKEIVFLSNRTEVDKYNHTFFSLPATTITTVTLCSLGIIANTLVIIVVLFGNLKKSVFNYLLMMLAISENFLLSTVIATQRGIFGKFFVGPSLLHCRLNMFIMYVSGIESSWITVVIALERFIAVYFPLKVHIYCNKARSSATLLVISAIVLMALVPIFFICSVFIIDELPVCRFASSNALKDVILVLIVNMLYSVAPLIIITTFNILIVKKMRAQRSFQSNVLKQPRKVKDASLVAVLTAVCIVFAMTSFPASILLIYKYSCQFVQQHSCSFSEDWPARMVFLLDDMNHAVNFFLYCITTSKYRNALHQLFTCNKKPNPNHHSYTITSISKNAV